MGLKFTSFSIRGIDVSHFNGSITWSKVNCNFAGIRVGYGKTTDTKFAANWQNAKGKVKRMPYWYLDYYSNHNSSSSVNGTSDSQWGKMQAENCWNNLKNDPEGIVFLDIESGNSSYAPAIGTVTTRAQTIAKNFLERMDELNGKTNGIYCSLSMLTWFASWFKNRPLWVAWYNETKTSQIVLDSVKKYGWTGKCLIWQYASDGDIDDDGTGDGISMGMEYSFLDLNAWLGTTQEYAALFGGDSSVAVSTEETVETALYKVKILIYNLLVRSGPGTLYSRLRRANFPGEYSIYEEKNGYGRISTTASEWISLSTDYVQKLDADSTTGTETETTEEEELYKVKILIYNLLVRSGPGLLYSRLRRANFPGEYSIYEEKNGYGRISTTASEWISLNTSYVQKISSTAKTPDAEKLMKLWAAHPELH